MSNEEWTDLRDLNEVAIAQKSRWEIEEFYMGDWILWMQRGWTIGTKYRGRPASKKVTVTSPCWRYVDGGLMWKSPVWSPDNSSWQRFPAGDITGEIEQ